MADDDIIRVKRKDLEILLMFARKWAEVDRYDQEVLDETVRSIAVS